MRNCYQCKEEKSENEFYRYGNRIRVPCKECVRSAARAWYRNNREYANQRQKEYYAEFGDIFTAYISEYRSKNQATIKAYNRAYYALYARKKKLKRKEDGKDLPKIGTRKYERLDAN